jgi:hypothetical protein
VVVEDDEGQVVCAAAAQASQVVADRETGLPASDDADVHRGRRAR